MVEPSGFRGVVDFLGKLGVYDIVLPFLLVFTILFAILEKTKILGVEKIDGKEITKKNINAMVAFIVAFLVIASTQLVAVINQVMANIVLLLVLAICFLLLVGVFMGSKEFTLEQYPTWLKFFMILMFLGIVVIFLNALGWLNKVWDFLSQWDAEYVVTIVFLVIIIGFIWFIVQEPGSGSSAKKESK